MIAYDPDTERESANGTSDGIRYRLETMNSSVQSKSVQVLWLDERTGQLYLRDSLDREKQSEYMFRVIAFDASEPLLSSSATLLLQVWPIWQFVRVKARCPISRRRLKMLFLEKMHIIFTIFITTF